jgi:transcriptional regulator with XRE-family HTH domain
MTKIKRQPTELDKHIGEAIALQRKIKNQTRKKLGEKMGLCYQQIQHYETGKHQITINKLVDISKALAVRFAEFLPKDLLKK